MSPDVARIVIIVLASITLVGSWFGFAVLMLLWRRSKRIDLRNRLLDRRIAAIGEVMVSLYPADGPPVVESRAGRKAKAFTILRRINDQDLDEARLAVEEISRPFKDEV